jgi:hypothetical protein
MMIGTRTGTGCGLEAVVMLMMLLLIRVVRLPMDELKFHEIIVDLVAEAVPQEYLGTVAACIPR